MCRSINKILITMKKLFISFIALAALTAGLVSCNNKSGQYRVVVEPMDGQSMLWGQSEAMASWDNTLMATEMTLTEVVEDGTAALQLPEDLNTDGTRCFVHPAAAYAGEGMVCIPTVQNGMDCKQAIPYYAEIAEGNDALAFVSVCGVLRLHLTTPEKIASISVSTDDSLGCMSGLFVVENYPDVKLGVDEVVGTVNSVRCEKLPDIDFSQGGDVYFCVAPGSFKTFNVTMTTADGRVCVKHQKEDMVIDVNRGQTTTVTMGSPEHDLVFE